jgi:adenosine deaminase
MSADNRNKKKGWISFRVKPEEYDEIHQHLNNTTHRKLSEYARKVLLNKPVTVKYRNQTVDEYLSAMISLKNELNSIGKNFNQAVKKLHTMDQIFEFRFWLIAHEPDIKIAMQKIEEIKTKLIQIYEQWSRE